MEDENGRQVRAKGERAWTRDGENTILGFG